MLAEDLQRQHTLSLLIQLMTSFHSSMQMFGSIERIEVGDSGKKEVHMGVTKSVLGATTVPVCYRAIGTC